MLTRLQGMNVSALRSGWLHRGICQATRRSEPLEAIDAEIDLVEVVREAYRELRLQRGQGHANRAAVDNFLASLGPSVVYCVEGEGAPQINRGRRQVELLFDRAAEEWESCEFRLDRVSRLGAHQVSAVGFCEAHSPSGETQRFNFTTLWTFREGIAQRIETSPGGR